MTVLTIARVCLIAVQINAISHANWEPDMQNATTNASTATSLLPSPTTRTAVTEPLAGQDHVLIAFGVFVAALAAAAAMMSTPTRGGNNEGEEAVDALGETLL